MVRLYGELAPACLHVTEWIYRLSPLTFFMKNEMSLVEMLVLTIGYEAENLSKEKMMLVNAIKCFSYRKKALASYGRHWLLCHVMFFIPCHHW